ncbi:MAG: hypothetical protein K0V04_37045, partial [Deltaproteobacteria bacterium]|nr:hypothetical protein [Deltaproteobacteria bacterium]
MGAFLAQCPDRSERVLACMASAADTTALDACTKPCVMAAADEIAPPVPAQLDTPRLDAACDAIALRSGDDNKANREACRRTLAQQVGRCPDIASKVLGCHAAARNEDAMTDCMLMCVTAEIAANP